MGIKILLADDSMTAQNMGKKILSEAGHEVFTVSNGAAAAKKIAEIKPELVLLDVFMPGYSGLELCERLRNATETARLPVLLTVGRMEPYNPQDGARVKADGVIVKPFEASDLMAAVERLLEKAKPAKKSVAYEPTVKIAPPTGYKKEESDLDGKQEALTEEGESAAPAPSREPRAYEPTMRLDASQIAAMLKNAEAGAGQSRGAPAQEYGAAVPVHSPEEFTVAPAADTAAFEGELTPETPSAQSRRTDIPSYMAQYLPDQSSSGMEPTPTEPQTALASVASPFEPVITHPEPVGEATAPPIAAIPDAILLQRFDTAATVEAPVAAADGLELTAAAPVPDVPIARETGFEATAQSSDASTFVLKDPALVTDLHAANMDFPTQFGTADPESADQFLKSLYGATETTAVPVDEFEARLNAAMSSYEASPTDFSMVEAETTPSAATQSEESALLESPIPESFEAQMEVAMQSFEASTPSTPTELAEVWYSHAPASAEQTAPEDGPVAAIEGDTPPNATSTLEVPRSEAISGEPGIGATAPRGDVDVSAGSLELAAQNTAEELPGGEAVSDTVVHSPEREPFAMEPTVPDTDEAVIQQMHAAFSQLPIDHSQQAESSGPVPMAMAAAASTTAPAIAVGPPLGGEAELEIASALAAAVEMVAPVEAAVAPTTAETDETLQSARDANKVAAAVEKVMQRELPTLIWKIMAELDLQKR